MKDMSSNYKIEFYDGFPAQVTIKNCRDCTFNIYPSQTRFVEAGGSET